MWDQPGERPNAGEGWAMDTMKEVEKWIERGLFASRWILVVFFLVLAAALGVYAVGFVLKFLKIAVGVVSMSNDELILAMLNLIDASLVASLIVMVMLSGYENFVSRIDTDKGELSWLGKLDTGSLKVKVASSIVAISSIHLLQVFLDLADYDDKKIIWSVVIHLTFVVSALMLAFLDRIMVHAHAPSGDAKPHGPVLPIDAGKPKPADGGQHQA